GLSGILAAGYFVDTNPFVNLWVAILGTGVFFCAVDYLLRPYVSFLDLAHYVRNGFPVLALESMVLISGYSLTKLIRLLRAPK
ncbi:MAG TPA: hypothetical protein VHX14_21565, partial [Thermoanaerobaculia bacterium]|nr:hypothetical protein [Thermoanaerobaculia bacterium]